MRLTLLVMPLLLLTAAAHAQPPQDGVAEQHWQAGVERYGARDFAGAVVELQQAYDQAPTAEHLYTLAQATRLGGDCVRARALYQTLLGMPIPPRQRRAVRQSMARCTDASPGETQPVTPSESGAGHDAA